MTRKGKTRWSKILVFNFFYYFNGLKAYFTILNNDIKNVKKMQEKNLKNVHLQISLEDAIILFEKITTCKKPEKAFDCKLFDKQGTCCNRDITVCCYEKSNDNQEKGLSSEDKVVLNLLENINSGLHVAQARNQ